MPLQTLRQCYAVPKGLRFFITLTQDLRPGLGLFRPSGRVLDQCSALLRSPFAGPSRLAIQQQALRPSYAANLVPLRPLFRHLRVRPQGDSEPARSPRLATNRSTLGRLTAWQFVRPRLINPRQKLRRCRVVAPPWHFPNLLQTRPARSAVAVNRPALAAPLLARPLAPAARSAPTAAHQSASECFSSPAAQACPPPSTPACRIRRPPLATQSGCCREAETDRTQR